MRVRTQLVAIAACLAAIAAAPLPLASAQDLESARARRAELQQRLDQAAAELATLEARAGELSSEQEALSAELDRLEAEVSAAEERVNQRVRTLFKRGDVDPMMALISTEEPSDALDRATVVISLARGDQAASEVATAKRVQAEAVRTLLDQRRDDLDQALAAQQAAQQDLRGDLEEAAALERRLEEERRRREEEEARRRAAEQARLAEQQRQQREEQQRQQAARSARSTTTTTTTAPTSGRYACPVAQPRSFTDTWGAPRSGGRRHRGTDILAPYGVPVIAVTDGVVNIKGYGSSAGNWLIFRGADGTDYWYMHLQSFTVSNGARVSAGTQIGTNGDTGNARGTPHVHFEQHPGGGGAINPYPFLRRIC